MHIDKCIRFYTVVKRLMYCGSVRLCQFHSFWVPFNTTNRVVRVAWIALNAKLTFLGPYLYSGRDVSLTLVALRLPWAGCVLEGLTQLHNRLFFENTVIIDKKKCFKKQCRSQQGATDLITELFPG